MNLNKWIANNTSDLSDKTVVITGGTGILAINAIEILIKLNANIILAVRNLSKGQELINKLNKKYDNCQLAQVSLDLSNLESINNFIEKMQSVQIDYFINNAGAFCIPKKETYSNYDIVFQTNYISPYYLTKKLLSHFNKCCTRVVFVSSLSIEFSKINVNDIDFANNKNNIKVYSNSKRWLTFSLVLLNDIISREYKNISLSICHPGVSATNIIHYKNGGFSKSLYSISIFFMKIIFPSPKKACRNIVKAMFTNDNIINYNGFNWVGPRIFAIWGKPKKSFYNLSQSDRQEIKFVESKINKIIP